MDKKNNIEELQTRFHGAILQVQRFGKTGLNCIWVETKRLREVALGLRNDFGYVFLENLSVMQIDDALVLTYFLRSLVHNTYSDCLVLRVSVHLKKSENQIEVPSVAKLWETARPFENESGELFGIRYLNEDGTEQTVSGAKLPSGWSGYPLRKDYVFPRTFKGIRHERSWADKETGGRT